MGLQGFHELEKALRPFIGTEGCIETVEQAFLLVAGDDG
jgi:hypothetical protein